MAAAPVDDELAAKAVIVWPLDMVMLPDIAEEVVAAPPFSPLKLSRFVHIALKSLAFAHAGPSVLFEPETKFTGAHF
jgi:hypothetical protein